MYLISGQKKKALRRDDMSTTSTALVPLGDRDYLMKIAEPNQELCKIAQLSPFPPNEITAILNRRTEMDATGTCPTAGGRGETKEGSHGNEALPRNHTFADLLDSQFKERKGRRERLVGILKHL
jgi:hypothetical protein